MMLATSVLTFVPRTALFLAVTLRTLPRIRPLALLLMLPLVTLSVTFCPPAVPARMLPLIARLTLAVAL